MKLRKVSRKLSSGDHDNYDNYILTRGCFVSGTYNMGHFNNTIKYVYHRNIKRRMWRLWKEAYDTAEWGGVDHEFP